MTTLTPGQKLEIARCVRDTFDRPDRWFQGGWGRDDDGDALEFDGFFHVRDDANRAAPPALGRPDGAACFCLGAAIRIHTGNVLGIDPSSTSHITEAICETYIAAGGLERHVVHENSFEPWLGAVIAWNDDAARTFAEVEDLAAAVMDRLAAEQGQQP